MALITDYPTLISEVKLWLNDSNTSDDTVKGWIQLAEARFKRVLATLDNEVTVTPVPSNEFDTLPTGFNGLVEASIQSTPVNSLIHVTPAQMSTQGLLTGLPKFITIISGQFKFNPTAATNTVTYSYFRKLDNLSDGSPNNYLIDEQPDVYLSATLTVAQKFLRDDVDAAQHAAIVDSFIFELREQDARRKWAGQRKQVGVNPVVGRLGL